MILPAVDALEAARELRAVWLAQTNNPPGELQTDLESLSRWFDPKARGERLRRELAALPTSSAVLGEPFIISTGDGRHLVSPEGRCLYALLASLPTDSDRIITLNSVQAADLEDALLDVYRRWAQQRLRDVIALQAGDAPPLLPQAIGQVLLLLVNGSVGRQNAMRVPETPQDARTLDEQQSAVVEAFADTLSPPSLAGRRRSRDMYSLRSGYSLTEARRRLGAALVIDNKRREIFLESGSEDAVIVRLADEIRRRDPKELERLPAALDALVVAYEKARPTLAAYGQAYSSPSRPRAVGERLVQIVNETAL